MEIQVGDLVMLNSIPSGPIKGDKYGIVVKAIQSSVFEGGEKCKILYVLPNSDTRPIEVMAWAVRKVNV